MKILEFTDYDVVTNYYRMRHDIVYDGKLHTSFYNRLSLEEINDLQYRAELVDRSRRAFIEIIGESYDPAMLSIPMPPPEGAGIKFRIIESKTDSQGMQGPN